MLKAKAVSFIKTTFSQRTRQNLKFDYARFLTRIRQPKNVKPLHEKLHLGCGTRKVAGWLNVDLVKSDQNVDLAAGQLPWISNVFEVVVSQHVIEHLDIAKELTPLLKEVHRVMKPGGQIWLSCPDMEKICHYYLEDKCKKLLEDRQARFPHYSVKPYPSQQMLNALFHQNGEHKNLFDFELLHWVLTDCNFKNIEKTEEKEFLKAFPNFPKRGDDYQSLYVKALAS